MICGARTRPKEGPAFRRNWLLFLNTRGFAHGAGCELVSRQWKVGYCLRSLGEISTDVLIAERSPT
jgi:hypothetical protein